jgi:ApaG protein
MSQFYKIATNKIEVSVRPEFINDNFTSDDHGLFFWRYFIKIKNNSSKTIQIINRYWKIINQDGSIEEISGSGVVGKQPVLVPQLEFEYDSQVHLKYPCAIMGGHYEAQMDCGKIFKVKIPSFSLDVPGAMTN